MTYRQETGDYQSDFLEQILDTEFRCNVPYKIDRKKYQEIIEKYKQDKSVINTDVVFFSFSVWKSDSFFSSSVYESESPWFTFYAFQECGDYDCFLFNDDNESTEEQYQKFIRELMKCVIGVDAQATLNLRNIKLDEIKKSFEELDMIDNIIFSAKN